MLYIGALRQRLFDFASRLTVAGADDAADLAGLEAVNIILAQQLVCGGNDHSAQLFHGQHGDPEVILPPQHQHNAVAALDAQGFIIVRRPVGHFAEVLEGEATFLLIDIQMQHGHLIGMLPGQLVHDIEGEIEVVDVAINNGSRCSYIVDGGGDIPVGDGRRLCRRRGGGFMNVRVVFRFLAGDDHRQEHAVLSLRGDQAVGRGGIEEDGIAGPQGLGMFADLGAEHAGEDVVEFLAGMADGLDGRGLQFRVVGIPGQVRLHDALAEQGGQVLHLDAFDVRDHFALAVAGDGVVGQAGAGALDQVHHVHAEGDGGFMHKGERHFHRAGFILGHFGFGKACQPGQVGGGKVGDFFHFPDTGGHVPQHGGGLRGSRHCCISSLPFRADKNPPQSVVFETG